jgi:hypothetical protein|nr:MAG TPA: hypothetical protein [Caudoviricetes sp.]
MSLIDLTIPIDFTEVPVSSGTRQIFPYYSDSMVILVDINRYYLLKLFKERKGNYSYIFSRGYWLNTSFYVKKKILEGSFYVNPKMKMFEPEVWLETVSEGLAQETDLDFPMATAISLGACLDGSYIRANNEQMVLQ